ncbi:tRNA (adenosine(37)-N6)-threonylcarbamoyltransferase complex transferase subunit TsaD [Bartonella machadoae]|uniref:tRNA (adenosine(37)-N6)-threonylcarbamoyltransferase complex transferase subunit TsaD n=1 Tax=Bartonella machadoae TaxID=2893471 RepID=UPI001F4CB1CB|nr:tRNA (adenosine(37)-N6)-threonylcarbamoyltransferase complex transferase subunit TsaD [Bartonella machadoae]UNE55608.1 tRNA (adenosine(37)-N6)-threonylcarbamoyltransferase complex transferase subunit TsaD [Bartonella machadoae]
MRLLGIETSCDETAAAVVEQDNEGNSKILSNIVWSQIDHHAPYGGVVPEIAARAHVEILDSLILRALTEANITLSDIDAIAATSGPGLIGGLLVGVTTAKALSLATGKPFIAVNHLEGHALTAVLTHNVSFPYLLLLVSGGHTQTILVHEVGNYQRLGTTIDDALGEAFDKTAKLLGLPYPGGPALEKAALLGDKNRIPLPRPLKGEKRLDFSFSGLKTAVRQAATAMAPLTESDVADIAASFQAAVTDTVHDRVHLALQHFTHQYPLSRNKGHHPPALVVAGGVAANQAIRLTLQELAYQHGFEFIAPPLSLCTDNAAMIAFVGAQKLARGETSPLDLAPRSRWPLDEKSTPLIGMGRRGTKA